MHSAQNIEMLGLSDCRYIKTAGSAAVVLPPACKQYLNSYTLARSEGPTSDFRNFRPCHLFARDGLARSVSEMLDIVD
jgi:hypothetical protein